MDVFQILKEKTPLIDEAVFKLLPSKHKIPEIQKFYDMLRDYPSRGGKRLRPVLVLLSTAMFGGKEKDAVITAAALELFHDWILIHDDIEDSSLERRGKPCLHRKYNTELAINAGDELHNLMWHALIEQKNLDILKAFSELLSFMTAGQAMEIDWFTNNKWHMTENDYYEMTSRKTAWYTGSYPIYFGAILASKPEYKEKILDFGKDFGIAFQIQDDILDLTADPEKFGKSVAGDIFEGKRTLMIIHLLSKMNPEEKQKFFSIMNKSRADKTQEEVDYVLSLMKKYKSIDYAKAKAFQFAKSASEKFDRYFADIPDSNAKLAIRSLIDFVVNREM